MEPLWIIAVAVLAIYVIPSIIAFDRGHKNAAAILTPNLLLGWTFLGWCAALVWSLTRSGAPAR